MRRILSSRLSPLVFAAALPVSLSPSEARGQSSERQQLALTIYNQGFGLVREQRAIELDKGRGELSLTDVPAQIQPESLMVSAPDGAIEVLEHSYNAELLSTRSLLERYLGRRVVIETTDATGAVKTVSAELLALNGGAVLRVGDEILTGYEGPIRVAELPAGLAARPRLVLKLAGSARTVELAYLTRGLDWRANYVLAVAEGSRPEAQLTGWVTLTNQSGASYPDARVKLVAGDVNRVQAEPRMRMLPEAAQARAMAPAMQEESFLEYHLYTLEEPTTLEDSSQKQVPLIASRRAEATRQLVVESQPYLFQSAQPGPHEPSHARIQLSIANSERNGLGLPLPAGTVRVYVRDGSAALQLAGEDAIGHTPRDETLLLELGRAFDVLAERTQTDFTPLGRCRSESAWRIELRNHKDSAVELRVIEHAGGEWEVLSSSEPHTRIDAGSFRFDVSVPAGKTHSLTYRVRVTWCS